MKTWKRLRDIALEVAIAVALVATGILYVATHPRDGINWSRIALAGNTIIVFGFLISWFHEAWRRLLFWAVLMVLLLGHTAAYIFALSRIHEFPLAYYVVLNSIELAFFTVILKRLMSKDNSSQKDGGRRAS
ncbi:MAG TPA: hypothetical protein VK466_09640 [Terriglobales bacterium]|nr:hypothetical protein [Terriglobales bacterium]